jgi:LPS sulfotransferase NodH
MEPGLLAKRFPARAPNTEDGVYLRLNRLLEEIAPAPVFVYLTRRDKIRQAISQAVAGQTGRWRQFRPTAKEHPKLEYDFDEIVHLLANLQNCEDHWRRFFRANGLAPFEIAYEDLSGDYAATLRRLFDGLGRTDAPIPPPRLHKHSDLYVQEWMDRFMAEFRERAKYGETGSGAPSSATISSPSA